MDQAVARWKAPEQYVGCCYVVTDFTIESINHKQNNALGTISYRDYGNRGSIVSDAWETTSRRSLEHSDWKVNQLLPENKTVNTGIKQFIIARINEFIATGKLTFIEKSNIAITRYAGHCVCEASCNHTIFYRSGQPCFKCSCGANWWRWRPAENNWALVKDPEAWAMLLAYGGIPMQKMIYINGGYHLLANVAK